jgi:hypothetical protein
VNEWVAELVGGPDTITDRTRTMRGAPTSTCVRPAGGQWEHFEYEKGPVYRYVAPCATITDHPPRFCDAGWYDAGGEHRCRILGPHAMHQCCCGSRPEDSEPEGVPEPA